MAFYIQPITTEMNMRPQYFYEEAPDFWQPRTRLCHRRRRPYEDFSEAHAQEEEVKNQLLHAIMDAMIDSDSDSESDSESESDSDSVDDLEQNEQNNEDRMENSENSETNEKEDQDFETCEVEVVMEKPSKEFATKVSVFEDLEKMEISVEFQGHKFKPENLGVQVLDDEFLVVKAMEGERKFEKRFKMPKKALMDKVESAFKNKTDDKQSLTIKVPKDVQIKQIPIAMEQE